MFDYKQLMIISDMFNASVAYKTLFLHLCGGSQFVSDVFAATHGKKFQRRHMTHNIVFLQKNDYVFFLQCYDFQELDFSTCGKIFAH